MAETYKICPICATHNHHNAPACVTCGTDLRDVAATDINTSAAEQPYTGYDYRYGETDLFEGSIASKARLYTLTFIVAIVIFLAGTFLFTVGPQLFSRGEANAPLPTPSPSPRPTLALATVTPGPPTATRTPTVPPTNTPTETPTPEPCMRQVQPEDTLTSIVLNCGHRDLAIIDVVVELNGLADENSIRQGQIIVVPWPTPTVDPNVPPTNTPEGEAASDTVALGLDFDPFAPTATATLQPGVTWHQVQPGENIIQIAVQYGATIEILSQLNPEVTFAQCDFGEPSGGGSCRVFLREGQLIRVPAPTATPTIPPTPSGSETPTPTPTPTFNQPNAVSPSNRMTFDHFEIVTLRWVGTAELGANQVYRVDVTDTTSGQSYSATTRDLFFIMPPEWQGTDGRRHEYIWTVSVINLDTPERALFTTTPRMFVWQARNESE